MSSNFGRLAKNTIAFQNLTGNRNTSAGVEYKPLNEICGRYNNKYINNADKAKSLELSIRENGLIEPIVVVDIDDYLNRGHATKDEEIYLTKKKELGVKYFISSGHRRFKACVSIALNRQILTNEELNNFYDDFNKIYQKYLDEREYAMLNGEEIPDGRWFQVACKISKLDEVNETAVYNDSNTTQRELTAFELVVNVIDELRVSGDWDRFNEEAKMNKINTLKPQALKMTYDDLMSKGLVDSVDGLEGNRESQHRQVLSRVHYSNFNGLDGEVNQKICDYIYENKQRVVSKTVVNYVRKALAILDPRFIECIYNGQLTFKVAKELLPVYNELDIERTLEDIINGKFDINSVKKKTPHKTKLTTNEIIELIYEIKNKTKTVNEVIKIIENAEK